MDGRELYQFYMKNTLLQECGSSEKIPFLMNIQIKAMAKILENLGWPKDQKISPYSVKDFTNSMYSAFTASVQDILFEETEATFEGIGTFRHTPNYGFRAPDLNITFEPTDEIKKIYAEKQQKTKIEPINAREVIMNSLEKRLGNSAKKIVSTNFEQTPELNQTLDMLYNTFTESFTDMTQIMTNSAIAPNLGIFTITPPYFKSGERLSRQYPLL